MKKKSSEYFIELILKACAVVTILTTIGIIWVLLSESLTFFKEVSISEIRLFFQFNRIICHEPNEINTKIKKITKTENKNLCFKDQINFPKYI